MAKKPSKVIITCAVTGAIHTPSMSPHLPLTPEQIARQALDAAEAGAAILHLHARDPHDGRPSADPDVFAEILAPIKAGTDAVINITSGGSTKMTLDERLAPPLRFKPEMASLNMGSMNFSIHPVAGKIKDWKFPWEKAYVEGTEDIIFRNTFRDIRHILRDLGDGCGTRFEFECYDVGHLYNLAHFVDAGLVKPPFFIQTIFGILGGIGPDPQCVTFMRDTANRLFGDSYQWSVLAAGRHQMSLLTHAAVMGANVRVGLEDSLYLGRGQMAENNAAQVRKIRGILEELGLDVATPAEARDMLQLKGADAVDF
ncbi:TPA: 3-keto-5-aminohexanoate cleavage protein [Burkholderia aenigmatica]|uniref:3-keto-5-aminohexanoate cleavage protein n=1 Tax=Burkholderia sp. AU45251 TaxID=3059204 RepID=UPI00264BF4DA|nr:3-keto-5-aminohexanoate cleavage protein [Burkholderia sp. AU45251]HDR9481979.1 3-keto-5-aminohexanoate cleavage protein [Burkholderia aenigmatica]MDN7515389.1 3-keto-5-aminohexanoate cleavage protein [Burkholderia sp. AU45251]HDR9515446.1 3-keto-5-aminohexanoate cleavage protein [Burkholderia aenigmatica]HDR9590350.1 3-keto-5-aminohexanoate cleavage protein [Burkholderia aenigmatica]HDR9598723.1 3-keto-5-aminohexanoate cleavage protein [Burkholderia aenigmatica]